MDNIKPGDVVRLKSGGPRMTVSQVGLGRDGNEARCHWFQELAGHATSMSLGYGDVCGGDFPREALEPG